MRQMQQWMESIVLQRRHNCVCDFVGGPQVAPIPQKRSVYFHRHTSPGQQTHPQAVVRLQRPVVVSPVSTLALGPNEPTHARLAAAQP